MSLKQRVRALEGREARRLRRLAEGDPRWLDPRFRANVRAMEVKMQRDATTIAQVRRATEALLALVEGGRVLGPGAVA